MSTNTQITDATFKDFLLSQLNGSNADLIRELKNRWEEYQSTHSTVTEERRDGWGILAFQKGEGVLQKKDGKFRNKLNSIGLENCLSMKLPIHTVQRFSDSEIFAIDDIVSSKHKDMVKISGFFIENDNMIATFEGIQIPCDIYWLSKLAAPIPEEPKPVLFTTEDGVELRDRFAEVWGIDRKKLIRVTGNGNSIGAWTNGWYTCSDIPNPKDDDPEVLKLLKERFAIFSTEQAANEYVDLHKKVYSKQDILNLLSSCKGKE